MACSGDPAPEDPIQEDLQQENLDEENIDEENLENEDGENINSDVNNEFVDNQMLNNEDVLTENDAVNFGNGGGQDNEFFQNEGEGQFQDQDDMFANNQMLDQGQQGLQGQQQDMFAQDGQQQDIFAQNGQQGQQMFNQQGNQFSQNQQMMQDGGEGINNAIENDEFLQDQQTDFQQAAVDQGVNDVVDQAAMGGNGGRVKYVTAGGSNLYDQPNGNTAGALEKGDHPLVFDEGEWARTSDGYYIPNQDLTTAPVSRIRRKVGWSY